MAATFFPFPIIYPTPSPTSLLHPSTRCSSASTLTFASIPPILLRNPSAPAALPVSASIPLDNTLPFLKNDLKRVRFPCPVGEPELFSTTHPTWSAKEYDRTPIEPPSEEERSCFLPKRGERCFSAPSSPIPLSLPLEVDSSEASEEEFVGLDEQDETDQEEQAEDEEDEAVERRLRMAAGLWGGSETSGEDEGQDDEEDLGNAMERCRERLRLWRLGCQDEEGSRECSDRDVEEDEEEEEEHGDYQPSSSTCVFPISISRTASIELTYPDGSTPTPSAPSFSSSPSRKTHWVHDHPVSPSFPETGSHWLSTDISDSPPPTPNWDIPGPPIILSKRAPLPPLLTRSEPFFLCSPSIQTPTPSSAESVNPLDELLFSPSLSASSSISECSYGPATVSDGRSETDGDESGWSAVVEVEGKQRESGLGLIVSIDRPW